MAVISQSRHRHVKLVPVAALAVQQEHGTSFDSKIRTGLNGSMANPRTEHHHAIAHGFAYRQSHVPSEFHDGDVASDGLPVSAVHFLEPIPDRFTSRLGSVKARDQTLHVNHPYLKRFVKSNGRSAVQAGRHSAVFVEEAEFGRCLSRDDHGVG
jgi:hypothetical protein